MKAITIKRAQRKRRRRRVRKGVFGLAERPRLTVFRSHKNISVQVIDDERGVTLCQAGSQNKDVRSDIKYGGNKDAAASVGGLLAERAKAAGITAIAFDRNGYKFHGRIKALADAAREGGLKF